MSDEMLVKYLVKQEEGSMLRYKEHIHVIRSNSGSSGYSNHILNTGHTYDTITDTMDVIRNTLEKYHTYKISKNILDMNYTHIEAHNPIFQTVHELYDR
jgi:hypothetical protein